MKIKRLFSILAAVLCIGITSTVSAIAEEPESLSANSSITDNSGESELQTVGGAVAADGSETLEIGNKVTRDNWQINDEIFGTSGVLSASNPEDRYFFTTTKESSPGVMVTSNNPNYIALLYVVDWSTGEATSTGFGDAAGDANCSVASGLPVGDYMLRVVSTNNTPNASYNVYLNHSNPSGASKIVYQSSDMSVLALYSGNTNEVWRNGVCISGQAAVTGWEDHYTLVVEQNIWGHDQTVDAVQNPTYAVGSYTSDIENIGYRPNVLFLETGVGTWWSFQQTSNTESGHEINRYDARGLRTPRQLDAVDVSYGMYIIIDLDTNQIIDWASPLNQWYTTSGGSKYSGSIRAYF